MRIAVSLLLEPGDPLEPELALALESGESITLTHTQGVAHLMVDPGKPIRLTATVVGSEAHDKLNKRRA